MVTEIPACKVPVVFVVFNRPQHTEVVFARIRQARPAHLLIIADGPRDTKPGELELCSRVREIVSRVDWPCEVETNFAIANMGCRDRLISGLNWAFEQVEEAIILEDDILPDPSFFSFCEQMLERFRGDSRISMITGFNIVQDSFKTDASYFYSQLTHIWGWATWRSSWARYDRHLQNWPQIRDAGLMTSLFDRADQCKYWTEIFDRMHSGTGANTWDYQWAYTNLINHALSVVPRVNLIENIGFGPGATHTIHPDHAPRVSVGSMDFPLRHPPAMVPIRRLDILAGKLGGAKLPGVPRRAVGKLKRMLSK